MMGVGMWCVEVVMFPLLESRNGWGYSMVHAPELSFGRSIEKSSQKVSELQGLPPVASVSAANPERSEPRPIAI